MRTSEPPASPVYWASPHISMNFIYSGGGFQCQCNRGKKSSSHLVYEIYGCVRTAVQCSWNANLCSPLWPNTVSVPLDIFTVKLQYFFCRLYSASHVLTEGHCRCCPLVVFKCSDLGLLCNVGYAMDGSILWARGWSSRPQPNRYTQRTDVKSQPILLKPLHGQPCDLIISFRSFYLFLATLISSKQGGAGIKVSIILSILFKPNFGPNESERRPF